MGLSVIPVFMTVGSLNLSTLIRYQVEHGWTILYPWMWLPFLIYLTSAFAETNRLPFDLPESETELVSGYHTEYSSMKFALFFLAEYWNMVTQSALMVTLFFGGWSFPGVPSATTSVVWGLVGSGIFLAKVVVFLFLYIWVRWTLPRFRYDQLMNLGWKVLLPLALANVLIVGVILAMLG
jgi:NADH-quinone oxidoreductase subunit H